MAKTLTPFHSVQASGVLARVVAAVRRATGPQYLRRPPATSPSPTALQRAIRNAYAYILAAIHFAALNTNAPRPYASGYAAAWRALSDGRNTWNNYAQARFAALCFENNSPVFPLWIDMDAHQRQAWDAAAAYAEPIIPPVKQRAGHPPTITTSAAGLALLLHEFAAPWQTITSAPNVEYPPMYRATPGAYTRAFWDYAFTPWDGDPYLWDNHTMATWADVPAPFWDDALIFWDAR